MGENTTQTLSEAGYLETISNAANLIEKIKVLFTDDVNQETLTDAANSLVDTLKAMASDADPQPIIKTTLGYVLLTITVFDPPKTVIQFIECLQNDVTDHQCPGVFLDASKPVDIRNIGSKAFATEVLL